MENVKIRSERPPASTLRAGLASDGARNPATTAVYGVIGGACAMGRAI
jgi:hypothetical protein